MPPSAPLFGWTLGRRAVRLIHWPGHGMALGLAVFIAVQLAGDGRSTWLQGAQLLGVYAVLVLWFLFIGASTPT